MISVVTPTYRTDPNTLARTWASLKAQTYGDWEWVVWDDTPDGLGGGGGGGGSDSGGNNYPGFDGGDGVVIIRYQLDRNVFA